MGSRGRKSGAELALVSRVADVDVLRRPDPPEGLSPEAQAEWREVVAVYPADHFHRGIMPLLEAYCFHITEMRRIDVMIQNLLTEEKATTADYDRLTRMHESQSRAMAMMAMRLGMASGTNVSRVKRITGEAPAATRKPWERREP